MLGNYAEGYIQLKCEITSCKKVNAEIVAKLTKKCRERESSTVTFYALLFKKKCHGGHTDSNVHPSAQQVSIILLTHVRGIQM